MFYLRCIRALRYGVDLNTGFENTDQTRKEFPQKLSDERLSPFWRPICIASGAFLKLQQPYYRQFMVKGKRRTKKAFPGLVTPLFESCYKRCEDTIKRWVEISSSVSLNGVVPTGQTRNLVNLWGVHRPLNASIPPQPPYKIEWHRLLVLDAIA